MQQIQTKPHLMTAFYELCFKVAYHDGELICLDFLLNKVIAFGSENQIILNWSANSSRWVKLKTYYKNRLAHDAQISNMNFCLPLLTIFKNNFLVLLIGHSILPKTHDPNPAYVLNQKVSNYRLTFTSKEFSFLST